MGALSFSASYDAPTVLGFSYCLFSAVQGRTWESQGEDVLVASRYASAYVRGAQNGEDPRYLKMIVTLKHWAGYSLEGGDKEEGKTDRSSFDATLSAHDWEDTYSRIFQHAIETEKAGGIMCSCEYARYG